MTYNYNILLHNNSLQAHHSYLSYFNDLNAQNYKLGTIPPKANLF